MLRNIRDGFRQLGSRRRGFRFSPIDLLAILICGMLTWVSYPWLGEVAYLFPIALGHFFLFCNVFRIRRRPELIWAGLFVMNVAINVTFGELSWLRILAIQTPLTVLLISQEIRSEKYHGIFCCKQGSSA